MAAWRPPQQNPTTPRTRANAPQICRLIPALFSLTDTGTSSSELGDDLLHRGLRLVVALSLQPWPNVPKSCLHLLALLFLAGHRIRLERREGLHVLDRNMVACMEGEMVVSKLPSFVLRLVRTIEEVWNHDLEAAGLRVLVREKTDILGQCTNSAALRASMPCYTYWQLVSEDIGDEDQDLLVVAAGDVGWNTGDLAILAFRRARV